MAANYNTIPSSFRDPSGFMYSQHGTLYRQINQVYQPHFEHLIKSGLYIELAENKLLISHEEARNPEKIGPWYKTIKPEVIPFISYPYEWSFSQLQDAAITTLKIQKLALKFNMILKDASAYNIQFANGRPTLIDTLSFEIYQPGRPWVAYRQFCQHFLAPLTLMSYQDARLNQLSRTFIDGTPLDLASSLLPYKTYLHPSLLIHLHLHAKSQQYYANKTVKSSKYGLKQQSLIALINNLAAAIKKLKLKTRQTEWAEYYSDTNYNSESFAHKQQAVSSFLNLAKPKLVWDLGANTGRFSRLASDQGINTIAFDIDLLAVEKNYRQVVKNNEKNILPLFLDLTNPSPNIGWANQERMSIIKRGPADTIMALALIHHLIISNNVPLQMLASFFSKICSYLIIEFVPKTDSNAQKLLATRPDIFPNYTQANFEKEFNAFFNIIDIKKIVKSQRSLYLMKRL